MGKMTPQKGLPQKDLRGVQELRKALLLSIGSIVILCLFLSILFITQISSLIHLSAETDKSNRIIASVIDLQKTALDMETGLRGYDLTKQKDFLEPYSHGKKVLPIQLRKLNELVDQEYIYFHEMEEVSSLMKHWIELQDKAGGVKAEVKAKKILDQFREITGSILDQENDKLESNKLKRINNASTTIFLSVIIGLVVGFCLALIIRKQMLNLFQSYESNYREMIRARKDLEHLNTDLEKKVQERTTSLKSVNDELEAFCYSVSHDLRSPLRGIDGFSLALLDDYADKIDDEGKKYLGFIRQGVQRMGVLIDDLLRLSRINRSTVQPQYFDILALLSEVIRDVKLSYPDLHTQFVTKAEGPQIVYGDRGLIRIVLENLYQNAVKYSSKEAFPVVEFGLCHEEGDPEDCFYIKDNGIGFSMEHYSKLFAAFQRFHSERDYPGNGIGLATVKRIIARHGGRIWAEGRPGQGATFYFKIADLTPNKEGGLHDDGQDSVTN